MKISLFTQSLFDLSLDEAVTAAGDIGFDGVEIACVAPHLDLARARDDRARIVAHVRAGGMQVAALSAYTRLTDPATSSEQIAMLSEFITLAGGFGTDLVKITPGPPASADMTDAHACCWELAMTGCTAVARSSGVRLAVETHLNMISDTCAGVARLIAPFDATLGVTLDFCNVYLGGDDPVESVRRLGDRILFCHVKNVRDGQWVPLADGELDYRAILAALRDAGYDGYLSIECLYNAPTQTKVDMIQADCEHLRTLLADTSPP